MTVTHQERILRTSTRYLLKEIGVIFLCSVVIPIMGIYYVGDRFYIIGVIGLVIGIIALVKVLLTSRKRQIAFSATEIIVNSGKEIAKESWTSIQAIRFSGKGNSRYVTLFGSENNLHIPCQYFNETELISSLKEHLPSEVFQPKAYQRTQQYLDWQEETYKKIAGRDRRLKVNLNRSEITTGIFAICVGVFMAILYLSAKNNFGAFVLGTTIVSMGLLVIVMYLSWMEVDNETIKVRTLFRQYEIQWNKVQEIYVDSIRGKIALVSDTSRLIVPGFRNWSGKERNLLFDLIALKIETSSVEPIESVKLFYWRSKNF